MNMDREKEEVIANGVKMRALMQKLSPSIRIPSSSSPASRHLHNLYAHDYPVFTPVTSLFLSYKKKTSLFFLF